MNGTTLCTISAPGCFGVQAKRAIGIAAAVGELITEIAGRQRVVCRPGADCVSRNCVAISASSS